MTHKITSPSPKPAPLHCRAGFICLHLATARLLIYDAAKRRLQLLNRWTV